MTSPGFIGALMLLALNDWIFKALWPSWVTGKLSDFAGVAAFSLFLGAVLRRRLAGLVLGGLLFAVWKLPVGEALARSWNGVGLWQVGRTPDLTDLIVLLVLPIAGLYARRYAPRLPTGWRGTGLVLLSCVAFAATSTRHQVRVDKAYSFPIARTRLLGLIDSLPYERSPRYAKGTVADSSALFVYVNGLCPLALEARIRVSGADSASTLQLLNLNCTDRQLPKATMMRVFDDSVIAKLNAAARR